MNDLDQLNMDQNAIDSIYNEFVDIINSKMEGRLQSNVIRLSDGDRNKHRRCKKPWWNVRLPLLLNVMNRDEKE